MPRLTRASFRDACGWIAYNDSAADGADMRLIGDYVTTALVADIFGTDTEHVAREVARIRTKLEA